MRLNEVRINIHNAKYFRLELINYTIELEILSSGLPRQVPSTSHFLMCTQKKLVKKLYRAKFDHYFITIFFSMIVDRCLLQLLPWKFLTTETPPPTTQSTCLHISSGLSSSLLENHVQVRMGAV